MITFQTRSGIRFASPNALAQNLSFGAGTLNLCKLQLECQMKYSHHHLPPCGCCVCLYSFFNQTAGADNAAQFAVSALTSCKHSSLVYGYYIGRTNTLSFIASQFAKCQSLPKSERIRFFVNRTILEQLRSEKPERVWTFISGGVTQYAKQHISPTNYQFI